MVNFKDPVCVIDERKGLIEKKRKELDFSKGDDSKVIREASFYKIEQHLRELGFSLDRLDRTISFQQIRALVTDGKKKIFNSESKSRVLELINNSQSTLNSEILRDWVESKEVQADGISYITWKNFYKGKTLEKANFIAYCKAMQLDWRMVSGFSKEKLLELALSQLNHQQQRQVFQSFSSQTKTLAFYLQDLSKNPFSCHFLIKNFLAAVNSDNVQAEIIKFDFYNCRESFEIETLWQILHSRCCPPNIDRKKDKVVCQIAEQLKKQHIVLFFDGVHQKDKDYMMKLLEKFWKPLVEGVQKYSEPMQHGLFMYWIDIEPTQNQWLKEMSLVQTVSETWNYEIPIKHDSIVLENAFSFEDICKWIETEAVKNILGSDLSQIRQKLKIYQNCNAIQPESLLKEVYNSCKDCSWSDYQLTWKML